MGPAYERMGAERGQHDPWTPELVAEVTAQRRALLDLDDWDERVRWRDAQLIRMRHALGADHRGDQTRVRPPSSASTEPVA